MSEREQRSSLFGAIENMEMGDDGEVQVRLANAAPVADPAPDPAPAVAPDPAPAPKAEPPAVDWEKRYNDLRPEFDRTKTEMAELKAKLDKLTAAPPAAQEKTPPAEAPTLDLYGDAKTVTEQVRGLVSNALDEKFGPLMDRMQTALIDWELQREFQLAGAQHGEAFFERLPIIHEIIKTVPQPLSFEEAFKLSLKVKPLSSSPAAGAANAQERVSAPDTAQQRAPAVAPPATPPAPQPADAERAARLAVVQAGADTGRGGSATEPQRVAKTVKQALELALEEMAG